MLEYVPNPILSFRTSSLPFSSIASEPSGVRNKATVKSGTVWACNLSSQVSLCLLAMTATDRGMYSTMLLARSWLIPKLGRLTPSAGKRKWFESVE